MEIWSFSRNKKLEFFQAVAVWVLLYGYTIWTLMKHLGKKNARWKLCKDAACCFEQILKSPETAGDVEYTNWIFAEE